MDSKSNFVTTQQGICIKMTFPQKSLPAAPEAAKERRNPNRNPPQILGFKSSFTFTFSTLRLRLIKSKWNMKKGESSKKAMSQVSLSSSSLILCVHEFLGLFLLGPLVVTESWSNECSKCTLWAPPRRLFKIPFFLIVQPGDWLSQGQKTKISHFGSDVLVEVLSFLLQAEC